MSFWISKLLRAKFPLKTVKIRITSKPPDGNLASIKNLEITLPNGVISSGPYYDDIFITHSKSMIKVTYEVNRVVEVEYQRLSQESIILDKNSPLIFAKVFHAKSIPLVGTTRGDSLAMLIKFGMEEVL
jgi:hypothetical protein